MINVKVCSVFKFNSICLQRLFKRYDKDEDDQIDFSEFVKYVQDHEKELRLYFKKIDTNDDGMCAG